MDIATTHDPRHDTNPLLCAVECETPLTARERAALAGLVRCLATAADIAEEWDHDDYPRRSGALSYLIDAYQAATTKVRDAEVPA